MSVIPFPRSAPRKVRQAVPSGPQMKRAKAAAVEAGVMHCLPLGFHMTAPQRAMAKAQAAGLGPTDRSTGAPEVLAAALARAPADIRATFLRELLAYAAAGLVVAEGAVEASEIVYRLAEAIAKRAALPTLKPQDPGP